MKKIYIAGPYSGKDTAAMLANIRVGINQAAHLVRAGHAVYCPFLDFLPYPDKLYRHDQMAVIGNIYENPELVKSNG